MSLTNLQNLVYLTLQGERFITFLNLSTFEENKRAQRALGRSPEEKVKGHSGGANNREPQGHNLNNFGRGPFGDVIY